MHITSLLNWSNFFNLDNFQNLLKWSIIVIVQAFIQSIPTFNCFKNTRCLLYRLNSFRLKDCKHLRNAVNWTYRKQLIFNFKILGFVLYSFQRGRNEQFNFSLKIRVQLNWANLKTSSKRIKFESFSCSKVCASRQWLYCTLSTTMFSSSSNEKKTILWKLPISHLQRDEMRQKDRVRKNKRIIRRGERKKRPKVREKEREKEKKREKRQGYKWDWNKERKQKIVRVREQLQTQT